MVTTGSIDSTSIISKMRQFAYLTGLSMREEIRICARTLSVSLAYSTQPYGKSKATQEIGKKRVAADIRKVFGTAGTFYHELKKQDPGKATAFWRAWKTRDQPGMEQALRGTRYGGIKLLPAPDKAIHEARRTRGRVRGKQPSAFVIASDSLARYIAERQKRVGLTKAGWARAALMTGGTRGIPAWASTRQPKASGGADINTDPNKPRIEIYNSTPWADEAIPSRELEKAIDIAEAKLLKRMAIIVRKLTGQKNFAA